MEAPKYFGWVFFFFFLINRKTCTESDCLPLKEAKLFIIRWCMVIKVTHSPNQFPVSYSIFCSFWFWEEDLCLFAIVTFSHLKITHNSWPPYKQLNKVKASTISYHTFTMVFNLKCMHGDFNVGHVVSWWWYRWMLFWIWEQTIISYN